jgi:hypothetical protein
LTLTPPRPVRLGATAAVAALALAACSPAGTPDAPDDGLLADHGLAGLDAAQIIDLLDETPLDERAPDLIASVRPDALALSDDAGRETNVPMPDDEFYVSVAPYVDRTHDCYFHSLTTCVGELQGEDVTVTVTDDASGEVLVDEARQTYDNGFVGLWLPRGVDATLTIEYDGRTGTTGVSTSDDEDPTCLTGVRLT